MGAVYSHLPEEERQVIQIKIGNGNSIQVIGVMLSGSVSTISREIKRNTCCPSNESELYRRTGPKYLKTGSCAVRPCVAADPAARPNGAQRRHEKAVSPFVWSFVGAGARMTGLHLLAAAG